MKSSTPARLWRPWSGTKRFASETWIPIEHHADKVAVHVFQRKLHNRIPCREFEHVFTGRGQLRVVYFFLSGSENRQNAFSDNIFLLTLRKCYQFGFSFIQVSTFVSTVVEEWYWWFVWGFDTKQGRVSASRPRWSTDECVLFDSWMGNGRGPRQRRTMATMTSVRWLWNSASLLQLQWSQGGFDFLKKGMASWPFAGLVLWTSPVYGSPCRLFACPCTYTCMFT